MQQTIQSIFEHESNVVSVTILRTNCISHHSPGSGTHCIVISPVSLLLRTKNVTILMFALTFVA